MTSISTTPPATQPLSWHDLQWCLRRAPRELLLAMKHFGAEVMVAGGYVRSCVTNEPINDIDCFVPSAEKALLLAMRLVGGDDTRIYKTDNAYTLKGFKTPIQIIHRWTFTDPQSAILSFDFTIARGAFWWKKSELVVNAATNETMKTGEWQSICDSRFYADLAAKRLIYCNPIRIEETGGSLLRVLKFYQRGYRIPLDSLGDVIARLMSGVRLEDVTNKGESGKCDEAQLSKVLTGLLREVDPNVDPSHIAHLPAESAKDEQKKQNEAAEGDVS